MPQGLDYGPMIRDMEAGIQSQLNDVELGELDALITPRLAELLTKAWGPQFGQFISQFTRGDLGAQAGAPTGVGGAPSPQLPGEPVSRQPGAGVIGSQAPVSGAPPPTGPESPLAQLKRAETR